MKRFVKMKERERDLLFCLLKNNFDEFFFVKTSEKKAHTHDGLFLSGVDFLHPYHHLNHRDEDERQPKAEGGSKTLLRRRPSFPAQILL